MKILNIFGIVVGAHVLFLIFLMGALFTPGCSSTSKPTPAPAETMAKSEAPPALTVPVNPPDTSSSPMSAAPISFGPEAAAPAAGSPSGAHYSPTRPGTPAASTLTSAPVTNVTPAKPYVVKTGDSLWKIANKNHITVAALTAANNLRPDSPLKPGQNLVIPVKAVASGPMALATPPPAAKPASTKAAQAPTSDVVKYTVKPGESLSVIAHQFGVSVNELGSANNIADPKKLQAGTELIIPGGWKVPGGVSGSKSDAKRTDTGTTPPESKPSLDLSDPAATAPKSPSGNEVPVIKIDEAPMSPAPKSN